MTQKEAVDLIQRLLKERPKDRLRIPDILKHKWFKKFGLSFDYQAIENESVNPDLLRYMTTNCYHDPFGSQPNCLESEIKEEKLEIENERRKKLRALKNLGKSTFEKEDESLCPPSPNHRPSRSVGQLIDCEVDKSGKLGQGNLEEVCSSKEHSRHQSELECKSQMRIIFKDSVAVIEKNSEKLDETVMNNIHRLTGITLDETGNPRTSNGSSTSKSQLIIDEIDTEYDKFEAMPTDIGVQTELEIVNSALTRP